MRSTICTILLLSVFGIVCAWGEADSVVLGNFPFEQDSLPDWVDDAEKPIPAISHDRPHSGKACMHVDLTKKPGGASFRFRHGFNLPELKEPRPRMVRVTLWIRTKDAHAGDLSIAFLKSYDKNRLDWLFQGYQDYFDNKFMTLPANSEWTRVQGQGLIDPEVRGLMIYMRFGNRSGRAQVWLDDLVVELMDRGIMFQDPPRTNDLKTPTIFSGEQAVMKLNVSGADKVKSGAVRLLDEEERLLGSISIPPGQALVAVELSTRGYYDMRANVTYQDGMEAQIRLTAAVAGPNIPDELRRNSPFGLCGPWQHLIHLSGANWDRTFYTWRRPDYEQAAKVGFPTNPAPPIQGISPPDRNLIFAFCEQPDWFQDRKGKPYPVTNMYYPPKDWAKFPDFIRYVVRGIEGKVNYVEVANEPDQWQGSWVDFVRYSMLMKEAVKSVNPQAKFMAPGFCNIDLSRIQSVVDAGLLDVVDIFSIHAYVKATPPEGEYIQKIRELKAYLAAQGRKDLPLFLTEYGWTIPPGDWQRPVDPITQARYVSRSSILLVAEEIPSFVYFMTKGWEGPTASSFGYAILNFDNTPRPAFPAFANVARMLTGVKGPGRVIKLSPTTYLALFRKGSGTTAAAWDTAKTSSVFVPTPWTTARDMTGRPLKHGADGRLAVSPSPVFVETSDNTFYAMSEGKTINLGQGGTAKLPFVPLWAPADLKITGNMVEVPSNTPKGLYRAIGKTSAGWTMVAINVSVTLEVEKTELRWPKNATNPGLFVIVRSNAAQPMEILVAARLNNASPIPGVHATVKPNSTIELEVPIGALFPGHRYVGELIAQSAKSGAKMQCKAPLDLTVVPCHANNLPAVDMDFSAWGPFVNYAPVPPLAPEDCSGRLLTGYDDAGLHLRVTVRDNIHRQSQTPKAMWQEDSIQVAFDLDAEKPWQANVGGCNGHFKVFEYGFALGEAGPMVWRWISYDRSSPADVEEKRVTTKISRQGDQTIYDLTFPWPVLGLTQKPLPGARIGFSLAVNDVDKDDTRHGLQLFDGIIETKDPARFGVLWIR